MRGAPTRTPLKVTLRWDDDDIQAVGRLGYLDRVAHFEYDEGFLAAGRVVDRVAAAVADWDRFARDRGVGTDSRC